MQFTIFTLAMAVLWSGIFIKFISSFRKQMTVLPYFSIYSLFLLLLFCMLRILFPVEFPFTTVIPSKSVLPFVQNILYTPFIRYGYIKLNLAFLLYMIWILGAVIIVFRHIIDYYRFRHLLHILPASPNAHLYHILSKANPCGGVKNVKLIVNDCVTSPAMTGFIHPVIILPNINFQDEELLGILMHECTHYTCRHHFIKLITEFICACFWWNPLFKKLSSEITHALEMHSDKIVCSKLSRKQQKNYLTGIIKVIKNTKNPQSVPTFSCSLLKEKNGEKLQQRFNMILENSYQAKRKFHPAITSFMLSVFLLSYAFVFQPFSEPTLTDLGEMDNSNSDYYFIESKGGYDLYNCENQFITHMVDIDDGLKGLKIKKNREEMEEK